MALEIERKFRVTGDGWEADVAKSQRIEQAYLTKNGRVSVRVRILERKAATLTLKAAASGIQRREYEYAIPTADAEELMEQREGAVIAKVRHIVPMGELRWEIDVFEGDNGGLVIAEVELAHADQDLPYPPWLGDEVTHDRRFYNAHLAMNPFRHWKPA